MRLMQPGAWSGRLQAVPERINPAVLAQLPPEMQQELAESMAIAASHARHHARGSGTPQPDAEDSSSAAAAFVGHAECREVWSSFEAAFAELATGPQTTVWRKQQTPGSKRSETEIMGQTKARELIDVLVEWAQTMAGHNLESLQWVLRKLQQSATKWPLLAACMDTAATEIQGRVQQQFGAPVHVFKCCAAA